MRVRVTLNFGSINPGGTPGFNSPGMPRMPELPPETSVFPFLLGIVSFRSPSPFLLKNGTEERNGTERFQFWEERNDENRRNDETGRSVPKLALQKNGWKIL